MAGLATKKDYILVSIVGLLFGTLSLPILENIKPPQWELTFGNAALVIIGFFLFANLAMWIAGLIGTRSLAIFQFAKYGAAGSLSAFIDLGVLNLFSLIFQIFAGPVLIIFNSISFLAAVTNAYFWNKFWAFKKEGGNPNVKEYFKFIGVTLVGLVINTSVVFLLTTILGAPENISEPLWENIAKLSATVPNVMWNFVGYKFLIFKS